MDPGSEKSDQKYNNITFIESLDKYNIKKMVTTQYSSLFLDINGIIYGCGRNEFGSLGVKNPDKIEDRINFKLQESS